MKKSPEEKFEKKFPPDYIAEEAEFKSIIGSKEIQSLMDDFYGLTNMGIAILDLKDNILISTGWQDICTKFHRINKDSCRNCIESDLYLTRNVKSGSYSIYKCRNNMWDAVTPIIIGNKHMGNLFFGQFFFDDEVVDRKVFSDQADKFGFDKEEYLAALDKVPHWSRNKIKTLMDFYSKFAQMISSSSFSNLNLAKMLSGYKLAEEALLESKNEYQQLFELGSDALFLIDNETGNILDANSAASALYGYSHEELLQMRNVDLSAQPDETKSAAKSGLVKIPLRYHIKKDGTVFPVEINSTILAGNGRPAYIPAIRDITERKNAEEALQKSKEELLNVIEFSQYASYKINLASNKYDYMSPVIENITGYTQEEMTNMPIDAVFGKVHPDDLPHLSQVIKESGQSGNPNIDIEYRFLCKDGNYRWLFDLAVLVKDDSGEPVFLYGVIHDINEKKILEIKLKESENRLKIATDGARVGLWDWMVQEGKTMFNEQWTKIAGYSLEELSPVSIDSWTWLMHPDDLKKSDELLKEVFSRELEYYECEVRIKHKNGKWIWVLDRGQVIEWDKNKNPIRMAGTRINIDRMKKTEEEILHLSYHDIMTGIYNRTFFEEEKKRLDTKRQLPLSVIMGDLNGLKLINDSFGHNEGDKIIKGAAEILKRVCRSDDIVARWGGDEFVILFPKTSAIDSEEILGRIKKECEKTISQKIPLSFSLGTATKEEVSQNIDLIITDSESNMYKNKLVERESISSSIMAALERALYEKSNETADHTDRIKELALKLGHSIKLSSSQLDELSLLASLHDIGKVAIPETVLMKKGRLSEKEWEIIKRHPEIGFNIAQASIQIAHVAKSILACHEHWDGSGYPRGLKGETVPVTSRIILIVDAYEVMTHGRIYKEPLSRYRAIKELKRCAGTQFDPILVNKFIKIISSNI